MAVTFPRFPLAALPTPLTRAHRLERALGAAPIWIKRDDLTGFATAGTKARPLEFLIGDAQASGAGVVVATGSPSSNFCAVAALAARAAGIDCHVLYAGDRPTPAPYPVRLASATGARLCFDPMLRRDDLDAAVVEYAAGLGSAAYPLPRGGATPVGALGSACAARELADQFGDLPATVVVATGSGGTQAGLVAGVVRFGLSFQVVAASVSRPVEQARAQVLTTARRCAHLMASAEPTAADVDIRNGLGPGFGIASDDDQRSAALALQHEGLLLDDTYTAKSMTLLRDLVRTGVDGPIIFWHTGGHATAVPRGAAE
jgi:D-cysteine desulfhydrase